MLETEVEQAVLTQVTETFPRLAPNYGPLPGHKMQDTTDIQAQLHTNTYLPQGKQDKQPL